MVSIKSLFATALAALPFSSAYLTGIQAPASAKAGSTVAVTVGASSYIQNWDDFGIVWGLRANTMDCGEIVCVGRRIDYTAIFPRVIQPGSFNVQITIPDSFEAGDYTLVAAVPYLVGVSAN